MSKQAFIYGVSAIKITPQLVTAAFFAFDGFCNIIEQ
jgi:hypothetical protein